MKNIIFIVLFLFAQFSVGQFSWTYVSQPERNLRIADKNTGYYHTGQAAGTHGMQYNLHKSTDGMVSFQSIRSRTGNYGCYYLDRIFTINADTIFIAEVCQANVTVLQTTDGGSSFVNTSLNGLYDCSLFFLEPDNGFISFNPGPSVFISTPYDLSTHNGYNLANTIDFEPYTEFHFFDDTTGILVCRKGTEGAILSTIDRGVTWSEVHLSNDFFNDLHFVNDTLGFAIGNNGLFLETNDAGLTWSNGSLTASDTLRSIDFYEDSVGYVVGKNGAMYKTYDLGSTWVQETPPSNEELVYVRVFDSEIAYVQQSDGVLFTNRSDLSIQDLSQNNSSMSVYPNPMNEQLNIEWEGEISDYAIVLFNAQLQSVMSKSYPVSEQVNSNIKHVHINTSTLNPGIYFIRITNKSNGETYYSKVIKD